MLHLTVLLWLLPPGTAIAFLAVHQCVTDDEQQAALDRIAAIDDWHDEQRSHPGAAA
ncbi:hypothetical protein ACPMJQ_19690 [Streptomyces pseudogriseolus]|uniref:hypothetical protein n=1 Tax=Streptomyces pseudogriseolus TaxID=36817 RepID=UPI003FA27E4B